MKVTLLRSAFSVAGDAEVQFLTSFLINDTVAIDAGSLGMLGDTAQQARIKHVFISHTHMDHIATLPIFVENAFQGKRDCVTVHGSQPVLDSLQTDIFNNRVWPDFIALSTPKAPFLKLSMLEEGKTVEVEGLKITPVSVNHVVPTMGFIIADGRTAVVVVSDTGPTDDVWRRINLMPEVSAVFLEVTFPDSMKWLAELSKHLTPSMLADEVRKLQRPVPVFAVHLKANYHVQVAAELTALGLPNLDFVKFGHDYQF